MEELFGHLYRNDHGWATVFGMLTGMSVASAIVILIYWKLFKDLLRRDGLGYMHGAYRSIVPGDDVDVELNVVGGSD